MKLDNESTIYGIHSIKLILAILVLIFLILMLITSLPDFIEQNTGISSGWALSIVIGGYLLFFFYFIAKGSAYFSYNDEGKKIIIRTFKIGILNSKKLSIEIPKNEFYKYTVNKKGLREEIILYVRKEKKILKYPSISIASVTSNQKDLLFKALNSLAEIKEK